MNIYRGIKLWPFLRDGKEVAFVESRFREFLRTQNIEASEGYLNLLIATNGGRIAYKQKVTIKCEALKKIVELSQLYPSEPEMKWEGLESQREEHLEYYPSCLFFVGNFVDDKKLAIVSSGDDAGSCVLVDTEKTRLDITTDHREIFNTKGVVLLAKSFDELLDKIIIDEE